jgi:hypothetical protein
MDENTLNELFGLEAEEGGNEQGAADPAKPETGSKNEPDGGNADNKELNPGDGEGNGDTDNGADAEAMSQEERTRQAYGRRQRELEAARADAIRAERARISETLKRLGIRNPDSEDGGIIGSVDELENYERGLSDKRLASGQASAEDVRRIVREESEAQQRAAAQAARAQQDRADWEAKVAEELKVIASYDPDIKTVDDLARKEGNNPVFRSYIDKGLSFQEAYELSHRDEIRARDRTESAEKLAEQAKAAGKDHLRGTASRSSGEVDVPDDIKAQYRIFDPTITDAEIRKHYNADLKKVRRK